MRDLLSKAGTTELDSRIRHNDIIIKRETTDN
jgi:hypothetical protein